MRFKRSLDIDSEGRSLHLGFLLEKFKKEFVKTLIDDLIRHRENHLNYKEVADLFVEYGLSKLTFGYVKKLLIKLIQKNKKIIKYLNILVMKNKNKNF